MEYFVWYPLLFERLSGKNTMFPYPGQYSFVQKLHTPETFS